MIYSQHLVNVSNSVQTSDTAQRELSGLYEARKELPNADAALVLNDWDPNLIPANVSVIPAWDFLLSVIPAEPALRSKR